MLKRIAAMAALFVIGVPAIATPKGLDREHKQLWSTLESKGVRAFVNPREVCYARPNAPMGLYTYDSRRDTPLMAICQDNRTSLPGREVRWTSNDLDTLRHEAMHFLQDCVDGNVSMTLDPFYDGPGGAPGRQTYYDVRRALGSKSIEIAIKYRNAGADSKTIRLEHEAFLVAGSIPVASLTRTIDRVCPVK